MITDYASLQTRIATWIARETDGDFTDEIPTFIQLAEVDFGSRLKLRRLMTQAWAIMNEEWESLPNDFVAMESVSFVGPPNGNSDAKFPLIFLTRDQFNIQAPKSGGIYRTSYYTISGDRIGFLPFSAVTSQDPNDYNRVWIEYYRKAAPLSDQATTNVALTDAPDVYLFGSLVMASAFSEDIPSVAAWEAGYRRGIDRANSETKDAQGVGTVLPPYGIHVA